MNDLTTPSRVPLPARTLLAGSFSLSFLFFRVALCFFLVDFSWRRTIFSFFLLPSARLFLLSFLARGTRDTVTSIYSEYMELDR